jgi:S1-C subfamily serine protease
MPGRYVACSGKDEVNLNMGNSAAVDLSNALAQVVEKVGQSVVRVEGGRRMPASGIVWDASGLIVTASHSVDREDGAEIGLPDGSTVGATLVGRDATTDVALLKVADPAKLNGAAAAASWSDGADLKVGHLVLGLGRPGRTARAALGIASAIGPEWRTLAGGKVDRYLQADIGRYPGFSGGPLVDVNGGVLGMNTSALMRGHAISVPAATLRRVIPALQQHGKVQRGFLGVGVYPVRLPDALGKQVGQEGGVLVISLQPGGPGEKAGLVLGDVLLSLGGKAVESPGELVALLDPDRVGQQVTAKIARAGQVQDVTIAIGARG